MIEKLINDELQSANKKFPLFSSWHEAYAVILEEVEEAQDEMTMLTDAKIPNFWASIKCKSCPEKVYFEYMDVIRCFAIRAIEELIQVAAMCDKAAMSLGKEKAE